MIEEKLAYVFQWLASGLLFYTGYHAIAYYGNIPISISLMFASGLVCPISRIFR